MICCELIYSITFNHNLYVRDQPNAVPISSWVRALIKDFRKGSRAGSVSHIVVGLLHFGGRRGVRAQVAFTNQRAIARLLFIIALRLVY